MRQTFLLLLAVFCSCEARAEIVWKQKMIELRADAKSTILEARYPFMNTGTAVDVTRLESSCGCTTINLEKRHYEPGESGEIVARYTVGAQTGTQTKTLLVETNDGHPPTTLTLEIRLPEIVRIVPSAVRWEHGEPPTPKTMTLEILQDIPAKSVAVESRAAAFDARVTELAPGRKYELSIRPSSTDQRQFSGLDIRCRFGEQEKVYSSFAEVQATKTKD